MVDDARRADATSAPSLIPLAVASVVLAAVLTAVGTFSGSNDNEVRTYIVILVSIVVAAAIVFGYVVRRGLTDWNTGTIALVLGVLAAISVGVFWVGLPAVLAGGAAVLGLAARAGGGRNGRAVAGLVLAALAVVAAAILAFVG